MKLKNGCLNVAGLFFSKKKWPTLVCSWQVASASQLRLPFESLGTPLLDGRDLGRTKKARSSRERTKPRRNPA